MSRFDQTTRRLKRGEETGENKRGEEMKCPLKLFEFLGLLVTSTNSSAPLKRPLRAGGYSYNKQTEAINRLRLASRHQICGGETQNRTIDLNRRRFETVIAIRSR